MAFPDYYYRLDVQDGVMTSTQICVDCGRVRVCGDWPTCPHNPGNFGEEPLEPYIDENLCEEPVLITTRAERRKIMYERNMEYRKKRTDLLNGRVKYFDMGK